MAGSAERVKVDDAAGRMRPHEFDMAFASTLADVRRLGEYAESAEEQLLALYRGVRGVEAPLAPLMRSGRVA